MNSQFYLALSYVRHSISSPHSLGNIVHPVSLMKIIFSLPS
jgi:hypothetical protein